MKRNNGLDGHFKAYKWGRADGAHEGAQSHSWRGLNLGDNIGQQLILDFLDVLF